MIGRRLPECFLAATVGMLLPLVSTAGQIAVGQLDSAELRAFRCGTHAPTLQRRDGSPLVKDALRLAAMCPEGPVVIASLWEGVSGSDTVFVNNLANVTSISDRRVADVLFRTLSDRGRSVDVRIAVMGKFLEGLTTRYSPRIRFGVHEVGRYDAAGRYVVAYDSIRVARLSQVSPSRMRAVPVDDGFRAQVIATIDRIATDPGEPEDMRLAAKVVAWAIRHGND